MPKYSLTEKCKYYVFIMHLRLSRFRGKAKTDVLQTKLQTRQFVIQVKVAYIGQ